MACPGNLWSDSEQPAWVGKNVALFWYVAYHAVFWLDLPLSECVEGFKISRTVFAK
jgi:hypothetical protein